MKRHQFLNVTLAAAGALLMLPCLALAQSDWPNKPVRVLVPFPAGGSTDVVARQVAQHLTSALGQQFIVDNRGGAGGNIGTDVVAKAAPDGYTLGLSTSGPSSAAASEVIVSLSWEVHLPPRPRRAPACQTAQAVATVLPSLRLPGAVGCFCCRGLRLRPLAGLRLGRLGWAGLGWA